MSNSYILLPGLSIAGIGAIFLASQLCTLALVLAFDLPVQHPFTLLCSNMPQQASHVVDQRRCTARTAAPLHCLQVICDMNDALTLSANRDPK